MKKNYLVGLATGLLVLGVTSYTSAATYTFDVVGGQYVGAQFVGNFDITSVISDPGLIYSIDSAQLAFSFADDDTGDISFTNSITTSYQGPSAYARSRTQTDYYFDQGESAAITVEGVNFTASSNPYNTTTPNGSYTTPRTVSSGYYEYYYCGLGTCSRWVNTSYTVNDVTYLNTNTSGANGTFGQTTTASDAMLTSLADGLLAFDISALSGDFDFLGARLTVDITSALKEVNDPTGSAPVPEPATMLLMGTGLTGLVAARRKKKA